MEIAVQVGLARALVVAVAVGRLRAYHRLPETAALATVNLNAFVPLEKHGPEAHFMRMGGLVEVIAQEWKIHPNNLREVLERHPRDGFAAAALEHVRREVERNPHGRFACLDPLFPALVRRSAFSARRLRADGGGRPGCRGRALRRRSRPPPGPPRACRA